MSIIFFRPNSLRRKHQTGVALIVAMLIVALVAGLAVTIGAEFAVLLKRSQNRLLSEQAMGYLLGSEGLARGLLLEDIRRDDANAEGDTTRYIDGNEDIWASDQPPFPIDGGWVTGSIQDLQGRFNVNNLVAGGNKRGPWNVHQARFIRLLLSLDQGDIDQILAETITAQLTDWLDADNDSSPRGGAEVYDYTSLEPVVAVPNKPIVDISELRFLPAMTSSIYLRLRPHIYALIETPPININTATDNVLRALRGVPVDSNAQFDLTPLPDSDFDQIVEARFSGFSAVSDFTALTPYENRTFDSADVAINSSYFLLFAEVELLELKQRMYSIIRRFVNTDATNGLPRYRLATIRQSRTEIYPFYTTRLEQ